MKTRKKPASHSRTTSGQRPKKINAVAVAAAQGVQPIENPQEALAPFWPKEESADDLNKAVKRWRKEGRGKIRQ
ncbi:MAG: hypothetical protein HY040_28575 [Planctomycetes bacterium]|nr:hypothetical protein [Planctomycetota bacterium]